MDDQKEEIENLRKQIKGLKISLSLRRYQRLYLPLFLDVSVFGRFRIIITCFNR